MSIAPKPSFVKLPNVRGLHATCLDFLVARFPAIPQPVWKKRILEGKVLNLAHHPISLETPYLPGERLYYFREVPEEAEIPFYETIVFQNEHLLVVDKPHFLPVTPGGKFVNQCLLYRLQKKLNNPDLVPLHRLDKDTAGLVLFSCNPTTRALYDNLFLHEKVRKSYLAVCIRTTDAIIPPAQTITNRLIPGEPRFLMKIAEGPVNAITEVNLLAIKDQRAFFRLCPITGKTHQLRVHLASIACPILNDPYYPAVVPCTQEDHTHPLQLLAKEISFPDPITQHTLFFQSTQKLLEWHWSEVF